MTATPSITTILPHLLLPGLAALLLLLWAKSKGATWTQVQLSFAATMFGAFMTASGWIFAAFLSGERLSGLRILGSQILVGAACGLLAFFGTMPVERDVTDEVSGDKGRRGRS